MSSAATNIAAQGAAERAIRQLLEERQHVQDSPKDSVLLPVYDFLLPPENNGASSSTSAPVTEGTHWYCSKAQSDLHRSAATYLLFLFAFRGGKGRRWIIALEQVVTSCLECAKAFGPARRQFGQKYVSNYPIPARNNFFAVVDKWQSGLILSELERQSRSAYGATQIDSAGLQNLQPAYLQLLFNEPTLLSNAAIAEALDAAIAAEKVSHAAKLDLGLTPLVVHLLSSPEVDRREWAVSQVANTHMRPLSFEEWCSSGVGSEFLDFQNLGALPGSVKDHFRVLQLFLSTDRLAPETLQRGLLEGRYEQDSPLRADRSIMTFIYRMIGTTSDAFPAILSCFVALLEASPTRHIWAFDSSSELPHTLFSEIKRNTSFQQLLLSGEPVPVGGVDSAKTTTDNPLSWITPFLRSICDTSTPQDNAPPTGFSEALAKVMNFCFAEMQHERLPQTVRVSAAIAGLDALKNLAVPTSKAFASNEPLALPQARLANRDALAVSAIIDVHASFIASTAFQTSHEPQWHKARSVALELVEGVFHVDNKEILERTLGLAVIAHAERKRLRRKRRAKHGDAVPAAVPVERLQRVSIRPELWSMAYTNLSSRDAVGVGIMMKAVAEIAHLEPLNRHEAWNPEDLRAVVKDDEWIASIKAINSSLKVTRDSFPRILESFAAQPDSTLRDTLWEQPGVIHATMRLLLSPADSIHEPVISLIQQSFEDVDDRADCFRVLLERYPSASMDGLAAFLSSFIVTATHFPEACSLAKWLVRCFTDVMEALCQSSGMSPPLLQSEGFLSSFDRKKWMTHRVSDLWQLMTDSLALIFKRTSDWAPWYENEVMVDWMRDALVFGRMVCDNIRVFESAVLSRATAKAEAAQSPVRMTHVGKALVQKLEVVLSDLVGWLRLTDSETLHQTFELIKTILGRISKANPDVSKSPPLEGALIELDKFCRRVGSSYNCRLSDDLLSDLAEILETFDLPLGDEIQFVKEVKPGTREDSTETLTDKLKSASLTPERSTTPIKKEPAAKNAFSVMMKTAGGKYVPSEERTKSTVVKKPSKPRQLTLEEFEKDSILDGLSSSDLDILERRASAQSEFKKTTTTRTTGVKPSKAASERLLINVVPKFAPPKPASSSNFTSKFMKDISREHKAMLADRRRTTVNNTFTIPKVQPLGSGLGAYTGPPKEVKKPVNDEDSDSGSSDSSDEGNNGVAALLALTKKEPIKKVVPAPPAAVPPRRVLQPLGQNNVLKEREAARARAHATKQRLRPDITPLYRYVLAWDPSATGDRPPFPPQVAAKLGALTPVPTTFTSVQQYEQVMLRIYLQELWAQFTKDQQQQQQQQQPCIVEVATRAYEDEFLDADVVASSTPPGFSVNDSDIVILQALLPGGKQGKPVFAKVLLFRRKFRESSIKVRILAAMDQKELGVKAKLQLRKHISLSTSIREFAALKGLPYYDEYLLKDILEARSANVTQLDNERVRAAMKSFNVNEPQAKAILGAISVKGFALIQGPPGTGKTKTISGLVGKFMSDRRSPIAVNGQTPVKPKLLVCAPSNAAIDEVCKRIMDGVPNPNGGVTHPKVIRIGIESSVNVAVKDVALDNIVEGRINSQTRKPDGSATDLAKVMADLEEVKAKIKEKQAELAKISANDQRKNVIDSELRVLNQTRTKLGQQSSKAKDAARDATRHLDGARRGARDEVLAEADIICATLSGAGHESLAPYTFETVIIDEAAQAIEMSCLIPLKYGCQRCIMVGDPNQLPPTTFSVEADKNNFNQSLFVRIAQQKSSHMHLLSIQYRMHPDISELPSRVFYQSRLTDGPDMAKKTAAPWHKSEIFGPYHFINVNGVELKQGTSTKNPDEARVAVDLYRNLKKQFGDKVNFDMRIGVISMYKEQVYELKRTFSTAFGQGILETIDFNTVDGFQGQEKDIIILSCVRSGPNLRTIGFLRDYRRMNVALTRAKSSLFVIGNAATLERSDNNWNTIVNDSRSRGFLVDYTPKTFTSTAPPRAAARPRPPVSRERSLSPMDCDEDVPSPKIVAQAQLPKTVERTPQMRNTDNSSSSSNLKRKSSPAEINEGQDINNLKRKSSPAEINERQETSNLKRKSSPPEINERQEKRTKSTVPVPAQFSTSGSNGTTPRSTTNTNGNAPSRIPNIPPPPNPNQQSRPLPRPPAARNPQDVLFMKKKKPAPRPQTGPPPSVGAMRQAMNGGGPKPPKAPKPPRPPPK